MTGEEIITLAELNTEELDIDRDNGLAWINECLLSDLPKDGMVMGTETVTIGTADTLTALTNDFITIFEIREPSAAEPYAGLQYGEVYRGTYDFRSGYIRMPITGAFQLTGYVIPTAMEDLDEECPVHRLYHPAIALWVAARATAYDDETNQVAVQKMQEYFEARNRALIDLAELMPSRPRFVRTRPWI